MPPPPTGSGTVGVTADAGLLAVWESHVADSMGVSVEGLDVSGVDSSVIRPPAPPFFGGAVTLVDSR